MSDTQAKLAVLIDADNAQPSLAEALLDEIAKFGVASVKRIYGDWTKTNLVGWKDVLIKLAIQPIQQFAYTSGKNATDSAMIIDAMDLLYTQRFDGFCLVSSDSDFTRLASRIREAGLTVYGFGERKTPESLVKACDRFVYVEVLRPTVLDANSKSGLTTSTSTPEKPKKAGAKQSNKAVLETKTQSKLDPQNDPDLLRLLRVAIDDAAGDDGWAGLGAVGSLIAKRMPSFDSRSYGFKKLSELVPTLRVFEVQERGAEGKAKSIYLRQKVLKPDV